MELDFDKEMDALLRETAQGETASANGEFKIENLKSPHPDADEIAAFAENALPEKMKPSFIEHFADCGRCRRILSNVVALNSETPAEIVRTEEIKRAVVAPIPWYRRFFAAPSLAYAMGALLLIFTGLIAFTFIKNSAPDAEIAETREVPVNAGGGGVSSDGETREIESTAPSNSATMSNAPSVQSNAMTTTNSTRAASSTNAAPLSNAAAANESNLNKGKATEDKTQNNLPIAAPPAPQSSDNPASGANFAAPKSKESDAEETRTRDVVSNTSDQASSNSTRAPKPSAPPAKSAPATSRSAAPDAIAKRNARAMETQKTETRTIGGKNFRRDGSVWYDAAYSGQSTTNITRGSKEFKKLDANLRSIADALSGTIVVIWKERAYRIQ